MKTCTTLVRAVVVAVALISLGACDDGQETEVISAALRNAETYQLNLASGDEDGARIVTQPTNFAVSEIRRDASTLWTARYVYQPAAGFVGSDRVELEVVNGSDGASGPLSRRRIAVHLTVRE